MKFIEKARFEMRLAARFPTSPHAHQPGLMGRIANFVISVSEVDTGVVLEERRRQRERKLSGK